MTDERLSYYMAELLHATLLADCSNVVSVNGSFTSTVRTGSKPDSLNKLCVKNKKHYRDHITSIPQASNAHYWYNFY